LVYGDLPTDGYRNPASFKWPQGIILGGDLSKVHPVDLENTKEIQEFVNKSWYDYSAGNDAGLHPYEGETNIHYTGPKPPYDHLDVEKEYSFIKTPRWKGEPMEVGPLARMLVGYASGKAEYKEVVDWALKTLDVPVSVLFSTLGRTAARGLETKLLADWGLEFFDMLIANIKGGDTRMSNSEKWDPSTWPKDAKGVGYMEAPRGGLAHWITIKDKKTDKYQMVVPTTWNASPRDPKGQMSPYESALIGTPIADPNNPVEILRTIHSFDPCLACAVHLYDKHGKHISQVSIDGGCQI
jgi:hydrogenase large subunit